jgi:hypothetical protein
MHLEKAIKWVALHQSAEPPFDWAVAGSDGVVGNNPSVPADVGDGSGSAGVVEGTQAGLGAAVVGGF